jgi:hypothetical protein
MITLRCRGGSVHSRKLLGVRVEDTHLYNLRALCSRVSFGACRRKNRS